MSDPFEVTGSTVDTSADDLLRELCGDEPGEAVIQDAPIAEDEDLAGIDYAAVQEAVAIAEAEEAGRASFENFDEYLEAHTGEYFVYDLQYFPDENRFPRPANAQRERQEVDLAGLIKGNADKIKITLRSGILFEDQLEELRELESQGKVRDTVLKEIDRAMNNMDGEFDLWKKQGMTDPWKGKIASFAWSFAGEEDIHVMLASDHEDGEMEIVATFWALLATGQRAGYGIADNEDKWIIARTLILGVNPTVEMDTSKYSKSYMDIQTKLFGGPFEMNCLTLAGYMGVQVPPDAAVGADVFGMVEALDWNSIRSFTSANVAVEKELLKRVKRCVKA